MRPDTATGAQRILFVCTGNICRSAFGHHFLAAALNERVPGAYEVSSAGTHPNRRLVPPQQILDLAAEHRIDSVDQHAPQQLVGRTVASADLVLGAAEEHVSYALRDTPAALNRTFTVLEFAALSRLLLDSGEVPRGSLRDVARLASKQRAKVRGAGPVDLADPYGGPDEGYVQMGVDLVPALATITELLVAIRP